MYINQQGLYVYKYQPTRCKACGSKAISQWLFGYPDKRVVQDQLQPKWQRQYKLGGCSIDQMLINNLIKSWHCNQCEMDFYFEMVEPVRHIE